MIGALGSIGDLFTSLGAPAAELGKEYGELKELFLMRKQRLAVAWCSCGKPGVVAAMHYCQYLSMFFKKQFLRFGKRMKKATKQQFIP